MGKSRFPVSEQALANVWKVQREKGVTWKHSVQRFKTETERIARPTTPEETFPDRVVYESCCGAQCRMNACMQRVRLHVKCMASFNKLVQSHGKISSAVREDILVSCEVLSSVSRQRFTCYAFVTAMSARSGRHSAQQVFSLLTPVEDVELGVAHDRFNDLHLQLCCHDWKQMKKDWLPPQGDAQGDASFPRFGKLRMYTTDEFVKMLLDMNHEADSAPCRVLITKLLFQDLYPSSVRVLEPDESVGAVMVEAGEGPEPGPDPGLPRPALCEESGTDDDESHAPAPDGQALGPNEDSLDVDLLALLAESETLPRRGRRRNKNAGQTVSEDRSKVRSSDDDDVLADPELQAVLGADEVEAFFVA